MYNSCKEAHIAVNDKIQQINANRQESIRPQYVDMALNEASDVLLTQKIKVFEETGRYYDDLQVLKCTVNNPLYVDKTVNYRGFTFIPANYLHGVSYDANVIFDKFKRYRDTKLVTDYIHIIDIKALFNNLPNIPDFNIRIDINNLRIEYRNRIYKREGIFEYINYIMPKLYESGYSVFYERFNDKYYPESLIFRFDKPTLIVVSGEYPITLKQESYTAYSSSYEQITEDGVKTLHKHGNIVGMDLVSDVIRRDMLQTYHNSKNRHTHPICTLENNKLFVDMDDTFIIPNVFITYLRQPTRFNIVDNTTTELPFKTEIINLAVQKLLGKLKDEGYQVAINENNALK